MNKSIEGLITKNKGQIILTTADDAYEFHTIQFPDYPEREAFIHSLPSGTGWERESSLQVVLHSPRFS